MAEGDGDGGKMGAFLLGFLLGVLVCLGGGGTFYMVQMRGQMAREMMERDRAMMAEMEAREAMAEAERQRDIAEKALREAKEKKAK